MKQFLKAVFLFMVLIGVGVLSAVAVVALLLRQEEVRVPNLTGQDIVAVIEIINQQGLQLKVDRRESSPTLPRDVVVAQTPAAGTGIKKGRQVHVVVSLGPSDVQAPKLVGENFRKADLMIRQSGYAAGPQARVSSETVERDLVISQDPQPGSPIDRNGKISLLISAGKKADALVMPKLTGKKAEEAVSIADRMGLQYRLVYKKLNENAAATRKVISQKPEPGWPVTPETSVDIVVSK